jgi:hypothetical protein
MNARTTRDVAAAAAAGAAVLLLADLSLGWHDVKVAAGGVVDIETTASGWGDLGLVAGLLTIAMLVSMIRPMRVGEVDLPHAAVTALLGLGAFAFATAAALTGSASVTTPAAAVRVESTLWPAYAGIGLGAIVAAAAITAFVLVVRGATTPSHAIRPAA